MSLMFTGLLLWFGLHLMPATKPRFRSTLIKTLGPNLYAGGFALGLVGSIVIMVMGWRSADQWSLYILPEWSATPAKLLILAGVILFGFGFNKNLKTSLKRWIQHLQLTGMFLWSTGHLILNGDNRSVLLFGSLGFWALLMMFFINRRDGAWVRPQRVPFSAELFPAAIALAFVLAFVFGHPWLSGIALV